MRASTSRSNRSRSLRDCSAESALRRRIRSRRVLRRSQRVRRPTRVVAVVAEEVLDRLDHHRFQCGPSITRRFDRHDAGGDRHPDGAEVEKPASQHIGRPLAAWARRPVSGLVALRGHPRERPVAVEEPDARRPAPPGSNRDVLSHERHCSDGPLVRSTCARGTLQQNRRPGGGSRARQGKPAMKTHDRRWMALGP